MFQFQIKSELKIQKKYNLIFIKNSVLVLRTGTDLIISVPLLGTETSLVCKEPKHVLKRKQL